MTQNMIKLQDFSVTYRSTGLAALNGIDLELQKGKCMLIAGPTGCGKTTLLRSLAGLLHRESSVLISGQATVKGMELERINRSEFAPRVGILFQNPDDQITGHTPREEIAFGLENLGFSPDQVQEKVESALADVELLERADIPLETLSGGQKQRVAAAAVVAMDPDLLLLDEPISNLDWRGRRRLVGLLERLKSRGMTIVICSHETEELVPIADVGIRMEAGAIVEKGSSNIFESPRFKWTDNLDRKEEKALVEIDSVTHRFGRDGFVLGPLDFSIGSGEIVALVGPNGGGKTTLISLLAGILKPDEGSIRYFGKRMRRFNKELLRNIGYISQNSDLMLHHDSVSKEVMSRPRNLGIKTDLETLTNEVLLRFNLVEFSDRHPFGLSQGQRQRLALAAATTGGADLVLIDEPTTGQDSRQIKMIQNRLREMAGEGASVIFSSHNSRAIAECASRVIVIDDGTVQFDGNIKKFFHEENLLAKLDFCTSGKPA